MDSATLDRTYRYALRRYLAYPQAVSVREVARRLKLDVSTVAVAAGELRGMGLLVRRHPRYDAWLQPAILASAVVNGAETVVTPGV